jgi:cold shock CspA family protein
MEYLPTNFSEHTEDQQAPERATEHRRTSGRTPKGREKGVKPEERGQRMTGRIARMLYGQSHGFIRVDDGREVFFHRKDARASLFNSLAVKDRVVFELIEDPIAGPRAVRVQRRVKNQKAQVIVELH